MSSDDLAVLEAEFKSIDEKNKIDAANIKSLSNGKRLTTHNAYTHPFSHNAHIPTHNHVLTPSF
jgi:hypothetical protein